MLEDKAPGPNGFPQLFFKRYWSIIQEKVCKVVMEFFTFGEMLEVWMRTFVIPVPKKPMLWNRTIINH